MRAAPPASTPRGRPGSTTVATGMAAFTGSYNSAATGLTSNTLYGFRAYASNDVDTGYGRAVTFTTPPVVSSATDPSPGVSTPTLAPSVARSRSASGPTTA